MLVDDLYEAARSTPSDIWEHVELVARLFSLCHHVTEFGTREGASTAALLFGRPQILCSYDRRPPANLDLLHGAAAEAGICFRFHRADVLSVAIEPTEFLLIDTLHTFDQAREELRLHAGNVKRFIAFHDTSTFGDRGGGELGDHEAGTKAGIWPAIAAFLRGNLDWRLLFYLTNNNGLTVIEHARADANRLR